MNNLYEAAERAQKIAQELGSNEATIYVSQSVSTELSQREGKVEKSQQSNSKSLSCSLLVDGRYSTHSISDTRPEALRSFLARAIEATKCLEQDSNRGLLPLSQMGKSDKDLELFDPTEPDPSALLAQLNELEQSSFSSCSHLDVRSITVSTWNVRSSVVMTCSNGYSSAWKSSQNGMGSEVTLVGENDRLPEAHNYYSARHLNDLPNAQRIAQELAQKGEKRLHSSAMESTKLPMLLDRRVVSRMLSVLFQAINGSEVYEQRSCLKEKRGERIAASGLSLWSDPLIPRALGSKICDGDGLEAKKLSIIENGVLQNFLINVYNGRRLSMPHTTGGVGNLIIPAGARSVERILKDRDKMVVVDGFLGGNSNQTTGDFSFGITGALFENGEFVQGLSEMNVSGNLFSLLEHWSESANDTWTFSSYRMPSLVFEDIQFSGT
jgi:PmbA protein